EDLGDPVEPLQLGVATTLTDLGITLDPDALLTGEDGHHLERRTQQLPPLGARLDLARGLGEDREDPLVVTVPSLCSRRRAAATRTSLALCQNLLCLSLRGCGCACRDRDAAGVTCPNLLWDALSTGRCWAGRPTLRPATDDVVLTPAYPAEPLVAKSASNQSHDHGSIVSNGVRRSGVRTPPPPAAGPVCASTSTRPTGSSSQ